MAAPPVRLSSRRGLPRYPVPASTHCGRGWKRAPARRLSPRRRFLAPTAAGLFDWVESQPPWSDFPFIVLTTRHDDPRRRQHTLRLIANLRNVTLAGAADSVRDAGQRRAGGVARPPAPIRCCQVPGRARKSREPPRRTGRRTNPTAAGCERPPDRRPGEPDNGARSSPDADLAPGSCRASGGVGKGPTRVPGRVAAGEMERRSRGGCAARGLGGIRCGLRPGARHRQVQPRSPGSAGR